MTQKPKYEIGQKVFFIDYATVEEKRITGVVLTQDKKKSVFTDKEKWIFSGFKYCFDNIEYGIPSGGWVKEEKLFLTKEDVLKSL